MPRGGPDGGDGGAGGDVVLVCDPSRRDLASLHRARHFRAGRGGHGRGKQQHGARGDDQLSWCRPAPRSTASSVVATTSSSPASAPWSRPGAWGATATSASPAPTRQAPRFAERGLEGESGWIELRLKLLADAGLVGQPNAGKSSLLRRLTRAAPKVADYPFTTLEPVLGTLESDERQLVLADIPGLIEGAAQGAGLGHEFLAHVERCGVLVHLVDIARRGPRRGVRGGAGGAAPTTAPGWSCCPSWSCSRSGTWCPSDAGGRAGRGVARSARRRRRSACSPSPRWTGAGIEELRRAILEAVPEGDGGRRAAPAARSPSSRPSTSSTGPRASRASTSSGSRTGCSRSGVAGSSSSSPATTSRTRRRSPTSSSA